MTKEFSENGWEASADRNKIKIKSFTVPGTKRKLALNAECAPILLAFSAEFHTLVERIDDGQLDDWGYAYRAVRGAQRLSNHASGTGIDLNAPRHPLGKSGTFTDAQEKIIRKLCSKYGIRWGGDYRTRKDEMHFEIIESPEKVKARIAKMGLKPNGTYKE